MSDFFEIDFLEVESNKSGDAISLRYQIDGVTRIHITDGGFQATGDKLIESINKYYGNPKTIDSVILSHQDGDHAGGLRKVLESYNVKELWMLRPWLYAEELIDRFSRFTNIENLVKRLKEIYPNIVALEEIANDRGIPILEPFQGANVGEFTVLAPSKTRYLDLVVASDKTPAAIEEESAIDSFKVFLEKAGKKVVSYIKAIWGVEVFSPEETSLENEMSIIQYANLCGKKVLLTGDAGRGALSEAADYAPYVGLSLPGIDRFQVPHHGGRRNVSTEILDRWLGPRLEEKPKVGEEKFTTIISASDKDKDHPRKAVVRALIHRGAKVTTTQDGQKRTAHNAPDREGWVAVNALPYPEDQEED